MFLAWPTRKDGDTVHFEGLGALESLNTDGLRTLATTMKCSNMKEKTLRCPYHGRFMEALRQVGFFDKEPIEVNGVKMSPLAYTSTLMFPHWTFNEGEEEFTVMRVEIEGRLPDGRHERVTYDLLDRCRSNCSRERALRFGSTDLFDDLEIRNGLSHHGGGAP